jgi:hypothetical protein
MSYIKTFMEDYLKQNDKKEIYNLVSIKYIIYNSQTRQFHSSNIPELNHQYEYFVKVLNTEDKFTIFISHSVEDEYFCPK